MYGCKEFLYITVIWRHHNSPLMPIKITINKFYLVILFLDLYLCIIDNHIFYGFKLKTFRRPISIFYLYKYTLIEEC